MVKANVRDPETFRTFLAGELLSVGEEGSADVTEQEAQRLLSYHSGSVEEGAATEAAVKTAEEEGVDLASVKGSGEGGTVTAKDVKKAK